MNKTEIIAIEAAKRIRTESAVIIYDHIDYQHTMESARALADRVKELYKAMYPDKGYTKTQLTHVFHKTKLGENTDIYLIYLTAFPISRDEVIVRDVWGPHQ